MTTTLVRPEPAIDQAVHVEPPKTIGVSELIPYRFTSEQFLEMGKLDLFHPDDRVELMEGEIFSMVPPGSVHTATNSKVATKFIRVIDDAHAIVLIGAIRLSDTTTLVPDLLLAKPRADYYKDELPTPEDTLLVIEVSFSTLRLDRTRKLDLYARAGVPEYWILNAIDTAIEAHSAPINGRYTYSHIYHPGETISPAAFPEVTFDVSEIMVPPSERPA